MDRVTFVSCPVPTVAAARSTPDANACVDEGGLVPLLPEHGRSDLAACLRGMPERRAAGKKPDCRDDRRRSARDALVRCIAVGSGGDGRPCCGGLAGSWGSGRMVRAGVLGARAPGASVLAEDQVSCDNLRSPGHAMRRGIARVDHR